MSQQLPDIWVVVVSDDMGPFSRPGKRGEPIIMEQRIEGATRDNAMQRAAQMESGGYGACRIARLVFDDKPEPKP